MESSSILGRGWYVGESGLETMNHSLYFEKIAGIMPIASDFTAF